MAHEESGEKAAETPGRPNLVALGFVVDGEDALAGRGDFQEFANARADLRREAEGRGEIVQTQSRIEASGDAEDFVGVVLGEALVKGDVERRREADGERRREEADQAVERNGAPGIEREEEVAFADSAGGGGGVEGSRQLAAAHFDFKDRAEREIGEEGSAETRHADDRKAVRK